jgi:hypothetical protein
MLVGCVAVLVVAVSAAAAIRSTAPGATVGTPVTGAVGIQRTTEQLMAARGAVATHLVRLPRSSIKRHPVPNSSSPRAAGHNTNAAVHAPHAALTVGATSFTGATFEDSGGVPPDSDGAVGPSQFLVAVNGRIRVFDKAGVVGALDEDLASFFSPVLSANSLTTDPRVRFDPLSGKWFVSAIDFNVNEAIPVDNRWMLAVSDGGTITNSTVWTFFEFTAGSGNTSSGTLADFNTLGIDKNALYFSATMFDQSGNFVNTNAWVIRKSSVTGAGPIVFTKFSNLDTIAGGIPTAGPFAAEGVNNTDPSATQGYFIGVDVNAFGLLDIRRVSNPGGTPSLSGNLQVTVPDTAFPFKAANLLGASVPAGVTVAGSSTPLDDIDDRLGVASIQNGKLYAVHNIGVDSTGAASDTPTRDAVRWYELGNLSGTPSLSRSGTIFDSSVSDPTSYWIPSIAVSPQGHAVIGMDAGSDNTHPDGAVSSMLSGTSTFSTPARYTSSSAGYNPLFQAGDPTLRWGDFSTTTVDPCDQQTFWTIQEYVDNADNNGDPNSIGGQQAGWGVEVGKIPAPPPATPASTSPAIAGTGQASTNVTLTGTSSNGSGFWDPGSGTCRIGASVSGGVTVNSVTYTDPTHVTLNLNTVGVTPGTYTVTITNPDGQQSSATVLTLGPPPSNDTPPSITGTDTVGQLLTGNDGAWSGSPSPALTRQWRRCNSSGTSCADIAGATGSTYTLVHTDAGSTIRFRVTGTSTTGTTVADSDPTSVVSELPANAAVPTVNGSLAVGSTVNAGNGTWTGTPPPTFTYQWQDCPTTTAGSCSDIGGATNQMYTLVPADSAMHLRVKVTGTNTAGAVTTPSTITAGAVTYPPTNTAAPSISGTVEVGMQLTGGNGNWAGSPMPTLSDQWIRCDSGGNNCSNISGATSSTYTLVHADAAATIRFRVTGTSASGSAHADSNATAQVTEAPSNTASPVISGLSQVGSVLSTTDGSWNGFPVPDFTYQWEDCNSSGASCTNILANGTNKTYTLVAGDAGHTIRVKVTATNTAGASTKESAATAVVTTPPSNDSPPTVTGAAAVGSMLTGADGLWSGSPTPTLTRQWLRCDSGGNNCTNISAATTATYTLVQGDASSTIEFQVTGKSTSGTTVAHSTPTAIVTGPPVNTSPPTITGTASRGDMLTEHDGSWSGYPAPNFTYAWQDCTSTSTSSCNNIGGASTSTYTPVNADEGMMIRVEVTATNSTNASSAFSVMTGIVTGAPLNTASPVVSGTDGKGNQLSTTDGSWTGLPANFTFTHAWERCDTGGNNCNPIAGANASTYTLAQADVGHTVESYVTASNGVAPNGTQASAPTPIITGPPANTVAPTVSGTTNVGDIVTAAAGTWDPGYPTDLTLSYQWDRCDSDGANCAPILGATTSTYMVAVGDAGYRLRVIVTGTNDSGSSAPTESSNTADVAGAPSNLTAPTITGTAQVGSTVTAHKGSWTGVPDPDFSYQWEACDSSGANCADISGKTGTAYTPVSGDTGKTLRVKVSASNLAGNAGPVESAATAAVAAAPSGGGGGGTAGGPDVAASLSAEPTASIGDTLVYVLQAKLVSGAASDVIATINLPSQVKLDSTYADRGHGCTGTTALTCDLDFLSGSLVATVTITTTVQASGTLTATASLVTKPTDPNLANNNASVTTTVPQPPPPDPILGRIGTKGTLHGIRGKSIEHVSAGFSTNEDVHLRLTVTRKGGTHNLVLLPGSQLDGTTLASREHAVTADVPAAGDYALQVKALKANLIKGKLYVIHLTATNSAGASTQMTIVFRA